MLVSSIKDANKFIRNWFGYHEDLSRTAILTEIQLPISVHDLNGVLGQLWETSDHPLAKTIHIGSPPVNLFVNQDRIIDPLEYRLDETGTFTAISENQGVWTFGYRPEFPDRLWVTGDWADGQGHLLKEKWREVEASIEDAFIFTLLGNLCLMSSTEDNWVFDDDQIQPLDGFETLIWRHPAWKGFEGFWANHDQTKIQYCSMGLVVQKEMP